MQYPSINIQGNIISGELIEKIRESDYKYQDSKSFGFEKNIQVRDEIGNAWAVLRRQWETFKLKLQKLDESDSGMSDTRRYWVNHLLNELGYEVELSHKFHEEGLPKINNIAANLDGFPIQIEGYNQSLDTRPARGGSSPHGRMQEYLNKLDEHLYGIICNGKYIRLLRDASRLIKLTYLEFNLEKMMEDELYADFAVMYRLLHASRMPQQAGDGEESFIEYYHLTSLADGTRIREKLSEAVEKSIYGLSNGFLQHPANQELRANLENGNITANLFYKYMLRLIYRILFLSVIEERHLIYKEELSDEEKKLRDIYYKYYSIQRHRKLADNHLFVDKYKQDLWENLLATFRLFENENYGNKLGIKPLAGDLFGPGKMGILANCRLGNQAFMEMMLWLNYFEDERKQKVRVNYGDLNVEEFGSVYEGLLEYAPDVKKVNDLWVFEFKEGDERGKSGSHYTPEELVKPLIKHSLDYIIEERLNEPHRFVIPNVERDLSKKQLREAALLSITVADVACGSGHILLSAARRIAMDLAKVRTGDEQPDPASMRTATRDVIRNCIYGVDLNPLAVELCKVALWLEAHNPGEPLNFLDHRIKCGNSIVGLAHKEELKNGIADEAFKKLPDDDNDVSKTFRDKNKDQRKLADQATLNFGGVVEEPLSGILEKLEKVNKMPETTPNEIDAKQSVYNQLVAGARWLKLKTLADMQVAQFFIPKTEDKKDYLVTDATYREYLNGTLTITGKQAGMANAVAQQKRFFHWFLEFPEIFAKGGFDCILGNPPYLNGSRISSNYGDAFFNFIISFYEPAGGRCDLVAYFLRRIHKLNKSTNGKLALITNASISQNESKEGGLDVILKEQGAIVFCIKSIPWPGTAATNVSIFSVWKGEKPSICILNKEIVDYISSDFTSGEITGIPFELNTTENPSFEGSKTDGEGFVLQIKEAKEILDKNEIYKEVIFPYLSGNDLNSEIDQKYTRYAINFFDFSIEKARKYYDPFNIVEERVKPYRDTIKREKRKLFWWQYGERMTGLYNAIDAHDRFIVTAKTSKHTHFTFGYQGIIYASSICVIIRNKYYDLSILESSIHFSWVTKFATYRDTRIVYSNTSVYKTFPFPDKKLEQNSILNELGKKFLKWRNSLFSVIELGMTKTYNAFHAPDVNISVFTIDLEGKINKEIEKKYGKETWNLWDHLQKTEGTCSWEEAVAGIEELRRLHVEMDNAVLEAYGWHEDSPKWGKAIRLKHDFYEVDYLPENDRIRYTIHPNARKEVLKRLLLLNHERYEEEIKQGLHKKADVLKFYEQKGKPVPGDVIFSDGKSNAKKKVSKSDKIEEPKTSYGQQNLFGEPVKDKQDTKPVKPEPVIHSSFRNIEWHHSLKNFKVLIRNSAGQVFPYHVFPQAQMGKFSGGFKQIKPNSPMAENIIGKQEGDSFEFGGQRYWIEKIEF